MPFHDLIPENCINDFAQPELISETESFENINNDKEDIKVECHFQTGKTIVPIKLSWSFEKDK